MIDMTKKSIAGLVVTIATVIIGTAFLSYVIYSGLLPFKYILVLTVVLLAIFAAIWFLITKAKHVVLHIFGNILAALAICGCVFGAYSLFNGVNMLGQITSNATKKVSLSIVVLKDSNIKEILGINDKVVGAVSALDGKYIDKIKLDASISDVINSVSYSSLVASLNSGDSDVIILNEAYRGMLDEVAVGFSDYTRIIKTYDFYEENSVVDDVNGGISEPFNIYISGIDTYGDISTVSRSDVNIVATVNPLKHKFLLTTIPRDSYVTIPLGGANQKDKLTHAGVYGVDASIGAVENLLDTNIMGYVRVNFTSLIKIVDKIGGITVQNPISFHTDSGQQFNSGAIDLNGADALTFARERHNLSGGDNDRGKNQQLVIAAIFEKVISPSIIVNFSSILGVLCDSIQTNLSDANISQFVGQQIDYGGGWERESIALNGISSTGVYPSYAMPGYKLYMILLDKQSVESAQSKIAETLK